MARIWQYLRLLNLPFDLYLVPEMAEYADQVAALRSHDHFTRTAIAARAAFLDTLGGDGWELVATSGYSGSGEWLMFKRELPYLP